MTIPAAATKPAGLLADASAGPDIGKQLTKPPAVSGNSMRS